MRKTRDSNMELLRIASMILIVLCHSSFCVKWGSPWDEIPTSSSLLWFGANVGVFGFVLVSGYYMIKSSLTFAKLLKLWVTVFTYSAGIYLLLVLFGYQSLTFENVYRFCAPITSGHYWFVVAYVKLMLLVPLLNLGIKALNKNSLLAGIILIIAFNGLTRSSYGGRLLEFCTLYAFAAYVRLYRDDAWGRSPLWWFTLTGGLIILTELVCACGPPLNHIVLPGRGDPLTTMIAVGMFMGFVAILSHLERFFQHRVSGRLSLVSPILYRLVSSHIHSLHCCRVHTPQDVGSSIRSVDIEVLRFYQCSNP